MIPRQRFAVVPFAFWAGGAAKAALADQATNANNATYATNADNATNADKLDGKDSTAFAGSGHGHSALNAPDGDPANALKVDNKGFVGIGTASPTAQLDINGSARVNGSVTITGRATLSGGLDAPTLTIDGKCFKPRRLVRCYKGEHMTWVDNQAECTNNGYIVEYTFVILAEC